MIGTKESWTDKNSLRDYPLVVNGCNFPTGCIVDVFVSIWSHTEVAPCVTTLNVGPGLVSVVFSDAVSGVDLFAAIGEVGVENTALVVPSSSVDVSGYVKFGKTQPTVKSHNTYEAGAVSLLNHCFVNLGNHVVSSICTQGLGKKILADLYISLAGDFIVETTTSWKEITGEETIFTISLNNPSKYRELCAPPLTVCDCDVLPIKQINTVIPDETNRNITIESPVDILEILSTELGISISALASTKKICPPNDLPLPGGKLKGEA